MRPDQEIIDGLRLGAIAVASAVVTAMLVIGVGQALLPRAEAQAAPRAGLIQASLP